MIASAKEDRAPRLNVADHLRRVAQESPDAPAVIMPDARRWSFAELDAAIDRHARGLAGLGVTPGMRVLMMVRPSFEFFSLSFALFRLGAVPVMLDPGMGRKRVLGAIAEVEPEAMIGIEKAHLARVLFPGAFKSARIAVTLGRRWLWGGATLEEVDRRGAGGQAETHPTQGGDTAAILFTSGSTGAPKGVLYTHAIFDEQVRIFREELKIRAGEVDLSAFPLFSLFSVALGVTCVVPDMDATRPGSVDPARIVDAIRNHQVTYSFGSPAFWRRVAEYCTAQEIRLDSLRRILMAGAPAPVALLERLVRIVPAEADVFTPYGATECLPITMPSARALLRGPTKETEQGAGTCVGAPLGRTEVRIIRITDAPIARLADAELLPPRQIGEMIVTGPVATRQYFRRPLDDARSKIADGDRIWHRMGDVGYFDESGRLWFCGRKSHRVETAAGPLYTECVEAIFNRHPDVRRSALVGIGERGRERPAIVVEKNADTRQDEAELRRQLRALGQSSPLTASIEEVYFHRALPVDPRHNAKIIREELAVWVQRRSR